MARGLGPVFGSRGQTLSGAAAASRRARVLNDARAGGAWSGAGPRAGRRLQRKKAGLKPISHASRKNLNKPMYGPKIPPPPRGPRAFLANHGKMVAGAVAVGALAYGSTNMSGRGLDRVVGRPTGMYKY